MRSWSFEVPEDCKKALQELSRMKVCDLRSDDEENSFADVWWHVQHEVDLFEEEQYDWREEDLLTPKTYATAKRWLEKYNNLYVKYDDGK